MYLAIFLILFAVCYGLFSIFKFWFKLQSRAEKSLISRFAIFALIAVSFVLVLFSQIPKKFVFLALAPVIFLGSIFYRSFTQARQRLRKTPTADIERMKRLN